MLPLKALVIDVVSIVGVIGALTWVSQEGHGAGLLGFTPMPLSLAMVLLMFCVSEAEQPAVERVPEPVRN